MRHKTRGVVIVPILIGLAVAAVVWVASYRGGGPKLVDAGGSPSASALAATPFAASGSSVAPATQPVETAKY
ncbi:hypothetical protein AX768_25765 [Burkholderia sp. PAMC 28687]|jgi:hypothetical protein|uniref:Uncharacterized protein n=1 Tax=Caballeronia sordidicola TaxID=196367 RepID=A0A242ME91_CABSO|nr:MULTISPECIES: hypothetical protein [Burkholderiaceae]AMM17595.1 hypothetical protein AX768_25765 [Burkholderia sp. PAMC 28687]OTP69623.1 hypothetical protein PAMC26510_26605 [Caballeronia sordidicola]